MDLILSSVVFVLTICVNCSGRRPSLQTFLFLILQASPTRQYPRNIFFFLTFKSCGEFYLPLRRQLNWENINITAKSIKCVTRFAHPKMEPCFIASTMTTSSLFIPQTDHFITTQSCYHSNFNYDFQLQFVRLLIQLLLLTGNKNGDDGRGRLLPLY